LTIQSLGLKKRMEHTNAKYALVGVSGGLDSTLTMLACARTVDMMGLGRKNLGAVTMPCFGTTDRTKSNAILLAEQLGAELKIVDIGKSVMQHFEDIGHSFENKNVVFENAQARERTKVLMNMANAMGGLVVGTGDLSETGAWLATYNGEPYLHVRSEYRSPQNLVRHLVSYVADTCENKSLEDESCAIFWRLPSAPSSCLPNAVKSAKRPKTSWDLTSSTISSFTILYAGASGPKSFVSCRARL
jgi:NAD+ synthase (glutamine-hydrolysing)